jgi:hypothetical protein
VGYAKADQNGQGSVMNVFEVPGKPLCVVKLLKKMQAMKRSTFNDPEKFVFRNKSEKVVSRDEIVKAMRKGARKLKIPENAVSVISL